MIEYINSKIMFVCTVIAKASGFNPFLSILTVIFYFFMFNLLESTIEMLIFGDAFTHWLDPIFTVFFIVISSITTYICAINQD